MIKSILVILILVILNILIILPPILHDYIYPTGGDDSAHHLNVINHITINDPIPSTYNYFGQIIIGYPLVLLESYLHIPLTVSFLWFNYVVLIGVVLTSYFVVSLLVNKVAGLLAAIFSILYSTTIALFQGGAVFNIVNMGIILLWGIYFIVTAIQKRSLVRIFIGLLLLGLFSIFHATGIYLALLPLIIFIFLFFKRRLVASWLLFTFIIGVFVSGLLLVALVFQRFSPDSGRQIVDGTNLMWVLVAIGIGILWNKKIKDTKITSLAIIMVFIVGAYIMLPSWMPYTSAVKPIDREVINYVNTLPEKQYYTSGYVAPYIYQIYLNKEYQPYINEDAIVYIWRSTPMTEGVNPNSRYYYWQGGVSTYNKTPPELTKNVKWFRDGDISMYVAEIDNHSLSMIKRVNDGE